MKKQVLATLATLLLGATAGSQLSAQAPVFSNYGVKNLTYEWRQPLGDGNYTKLIKPETACEGNNLHLLWQEDDWGTYAVWYRRSKDLGKTWEQPVAILPFKGTKYDGDIDQVDNKVMEVKDGIVHLAINDAYGNLKYMRSTDGVNFETTTAANFDGYSPCENVHMQINGNKIVIAFKYYRTIYVAYSSDAGKTFKLIDPEIHEDSRLHDLAFDGQHMVIYSARAYGYYNDYGQVVVSYSDDQGTSFKHSILSPSLGKEADGSDIYRSWINNNGSHDSQSWQLMTLEGKYCYAIFSSRISEDNDTKQILFAKSDDYGKTWDTPRCLDTDQIKATLTDHKWMLKAKGDNVYVVLPTNQEVGWYETGHTVFHSHDCGKTFQTQDAWVESTHTRGHLTDFWLTFDPNDASGQTAYITNNDYCWIKTTDGFRTISQATFGDSYCPDNVGLWENLYTQLEIDKNGHRHWFISYSPNGNDNRHDVCYRFDAGEPEPSATNQSFLVKGKENRRISSRVNIPAAANYQATETFTVEMWVKTTDNETSNVLAFQSHAPSQNPSSGWVFKKGKRQSWEEPTFWIELCNDKDDRIELCQNEYDSNLRDQDTHVEANKWYHLAFTYDAKNQFVSFYVNGALAIKKHFAGKYGWGWNPIVLGHQENWEDFAGYELDNFRVWNRILTADELRQSMLDDKLTKADGLCVNLGFDGTLRDLSGNGNDGYGASDVDFTPANRTIPTVAFDFYRTETGEVKFASRSNVSNLLWTFGDGQKSTQAHPTHIYSEPGEYLVTLTGSNSSATAYAQQRVSVAGLTGISPTEAGNEGNLMLTITGGGLTNSSRVKIVRNGAEIYALQSTLVKPGVLLAQIPLDGAEQGLWDVVVDGTTLKEALRVVTPQIEQPWMSVDGRDICLYNKWQTYTINYGNEGNIDAYNVPLFLYISYTPGMEIEMIDFEFEKPQLDPNRLSAQEIEAFNQKLDEVGPGSIITDENTGKQWIGYPIIAPVVPAGSSNAIHIRIKSPSDFSFRYWTTYGWGSIPDEALTEAPMRARTAEKWEEQGLCMYKYLAWGVAGIVADAVGLGCVYSVGKTMVDTTCDAYDYRTGGSTDGKTLFKNLGWNLGGCIFSCALGELEAVAGAVKLAATMASVAFTGASNAAAVRDCAGGPDNGKDVNARSSWDPNEMIGPSGYRDANDQHWIKSGGSMPYTILFENKAEATAPAHTVFVSDTLDIQKYDLSQFNFTAIGWGDNIIDVSNGNCTEFCRDIDLRPAQPLILRTSGKLHPETGIVEWMFISLNPETMEEEEDPMIGFLPPNNDAHAGEGFVSFVIGQQQLNSGDRISNMASIVFDANAPILTNTFVNAIDDDLPTSAAYLVEKEGSKLRVSWTGNDASSGVAHYEVWMTKNGGEFENISSHNPENSLLIDADYLTTYGFYTVVTDNVGNVEHKSPLCEVNYTTAALHSLESISNPQLRNDGSRQCEIMLPRDMSDVQLTVLSADGNVLAKQHLGNGQRFTFELPAAGGSIVTITTGTGDRFSWKVATR